MTHEQLVKQLRTRAALADSVQAEMLLHSILRVLGSRITDESRENLAAQLPPQTVEYFTRDQQFQRLDYEQFLNAIWEPLADWAARADTPGQVKAAIDLLRESLAPGTMERIRPQFPAGFGFIFGDEN